MVELKNNETRDVTIRLPTRKAKYVSTKTLSDELAERV